MANWLETIGREFAGVYRNSDVYQTTVDVTKHILEADKCKLAVASENVLIPKVSTSGLHEDMQTKLPIASSLPGSVYEQGEPCVIEDLLDVRGSASSQQTTSSMSLRSLIMVPFGDRGVLIAGANEPHAFDERDRELMVDICSVAIGALESTELQSGDKEFDRLEEVTSILSHDIKTPLNVAHGRLELAQATGDSSHLEHVETAIDRIEEITDDLVMLAQTDNRIGSMSRVDLREAVNTAWMTVGTPCADLTQTESETIVGDRSTLCQLLENILENAIDHGGAEVTIMVGVTDSGFFIEDDGPGIPPDDREEVFDWRSSSSSDNTGLGLSIVREIVRAHDWEIGITESTLGGARFEITGVGMPESTA